MRSAKFKRRRSSQRAERFPEGADACRSRDNQLVIDTRNVWNGNLPEFDSEAIGAKHKAVKNVSMTKMETAIWHQIQALIQRFQRADRIVFGNPNAELCASL
jgi:FMN-dependent NADH-azoreductase